MRYKLVKGTNPTIPSFGKYVAKAIHPTTVSAENICAEIERNCSAKKSDVILVLTELQDVIISHLQRGDRVELPSLGTLKLEIASRTVPSPSDFNIRNHIRRVSLHILPKCQNGIPEVYKGMRLEAEKSSHCYPADTDA